ncbi:hypothetical protein ACWGQ5_48480, partial [Streptomyces sp. NPDC055722]
MVQFLLDRSGRQVTEAVRCRIDFKYALTPELEEPGFHQLQGRGVLPRAPRPGRSRPPPRPRLARLKDAGLVRERTTIRADFLRSQAKALLTCHLFETGTLTGARLYIFAVIEHSTRRIQLLGATAHPTTDWIVQLGRNLLIDLKNAGSKARFLIRDRD